MDATTQVEALEDFVCEITMALMATGKLKRPMVERIKQGRRQMAAAFAGRPEGERAARVADLAEATLTVLSDDDHRALLKRL